MGPLRESMSINEHITSEQTSQIIEEALKLAYIDLSL